MEVESTQVLIFFLITAAIAFATYLKCRGTRSKDGSSKEYFLAGGGLSWVFVAGSITVTDIGAQVWIQIKGVGFTVIYTAIVTFIILKVLDAVMGLRVTEEEESVGLDLAQHNERGYNL